MCIKASKRYERRLKFQGINQSDCNKFIRNDLKILGQQFFIIYVYNQNLLFHHLPNFNGNFFDRINKFWSLLF